MLEQHALLALMFEQVRRASPGVLRRQAVDHLLSILRGHLAGMRHSLLPALSASDPTVDLAHQIVGSYAWMEQALTAAIASDVNSPLFGETFEPLAEATAAMLSMERGVLIPWIHRVLRPTAAEGLASALEHHFGHSD
ncbi:MAG: hypothetical protein ABI887_05005 [Burkholderiales bacterium]